MKKLIQNAFGIFLYQVLATTQVKAQDDDKVIDFGIKGGLNYSWLGLEDADEEPGKIGFHAGILSRINIAEHFALQGEALYSQKGTRVTYENAFFEGEAKLLLHYIEIPVLLVVKLSDNINIQGGPYVAFLLDAKAKNESSADIFDFEDEVDDDFFKTTDYGLSVGLGFEMKKFHSGIRYNHGLQEIEEEKEILGTNYTFSDAKNSMAQIFIGFIF